MVINRCFSEIDSWDEHDDDIQYTILEFEIFLKLMISSEEADAKLQAA